MTAVLWGTGALICAVSFAGFLWRWTSSEYGRSNPVRLIAKTLVMFALYFGLLACMFAAMWTSV